MTSTALDAVELRLLDVAHHLPAHQDYRAIRDAGGNRIITRAEGCYIHDSDGNKILDAMAGLWCVQVGYGRRELADAAYEQMMALPFYNTFFRTVTPPAVLLATRLAALLGEPLSHIFFNNSGSEAIDTLIRIVRHYWQLRGEVERNVIIARHNAYHGSTIAGVSLGAHQRPIIDLLLLRFAVSAGGAHFGIQREQIVDILSYRDFAMPRTAAHYIFKY